MPHHHDFPTQRHVTPFPALPSTPNMHCVKAGAPATAAADMPLTAQTADVLSAYSAEQGVESASHAFESMAAYCCGWCNLGEKSFLDNFSAVHQTGFKEISVQDLATLRDSNGRDVALLDVRTPEEYGEHPQCVWLRLSLLSTCSTCGPVELSCR
jgi:hypothetical protein